MDNQTQAFIEAYNRLESWFESTLNLGHTTSFARLIDIASDKYSIVRRYRDLLHDFRQLRNVLVHEAGNKVIATPTEAAVKALDRILEILDHDKTVYDVITKGVKVMSSKQSMASALRLIKDHDISHIPIYNKTKCMGLLNGKSITTWLAGSMDNNGDFIHNLENITVQEVFDESDLRIQDVIRFIPRTLSLIDFTERVQDNEAFGGIYGITENGKASEKLLGIVTRRDIVHIYETMDVSL